MPLPPSISNRFPSAIAFISHRIPSAISDRFPSAIIDPQSTTDQQLTISI